MSREWIVSFIDTGNGHVKLRVDERHEIGQPGLSLEKDLSLYEIERMVTVGTSSLFFQVRNLT